MGDAVIDPNANATLTRSATCGSPLVEATAAKSPRGFSNRSNSKDEYPSRYVEFLINATVSSWGSTCSTVIHLCPSSPVRLQYRTSGLPKMAGTPAILSVYHSYIHLTVPGGTGLSLSRVDRRSSRS